MNLLILFVLFFVGFIIGAALAANAMVDMIDERFPPSKSVSDLEREALEETVRSMH